MQFELVVSETRRYFSGTLNYDNCGSLCPCKAEQSPKRYCNNSSASTKIISKKTHMLGYIIQWTVMWPTLVGFYGILTDILSKDNKFWVHFRDLSGQCVLHIADHPIVTFQMAQSLYIRRRFHFALCRDVMESI